MLKEAVFTMKLEPELRAEVMAAAAAVHRPASQILRELMREFVQRQRETREYDEFLRRKVEVGRATMHAGLGRSNDEIEAKFTARDVPRRRAECEGRLDTQAQQDRIAIRKDCGNRDDRLDHRRTQR